MNIQKILITVSAAILALVSVSCVKDDTLYYNNMTMGNIVDGDFVSDQGNRFNVVEQTCAGRVDTMQRAIMICDVMNVSEGKENAYDVRVKQLAEVLTKEPLATAEATGDATACDPIHLTELWYSGGYLNMYLQVPVNVNNKTRHLINLVYEIAEDGAYIFELRHNAFGDIVSNIGSNLRFGGNYVSFPIIEAIGKDSAKIIVRWKWFEADPNGYGWSGTEKIFTIEYDWKREGFEQVPTALALRSENAVR